MTDKVSAEDNEKLFTDADVREGKIIQAYFEQLSSEFPDWTEDQKLLALSAFSSGWHVRKNHFRVWVTGHTV